MFQCHRHYDIFEDCVQKYQSCTGGVCIKLSTDSDECYQGGAYRQGACTGQCRTGMKLIVHRLLKLSLLERIYRQWKCFIGLFL